MLNHDDIWTAIDRLAQDKGMSPSGLARCAGLDPTTFNRSKRITREGKARWPSTESISKILAATETPLDRFLGVMPAPRTSGGNATVPLASFTKLKDGHPFDARINGSTVWDEIPAPSVTDPAAFAIEITGSRFEPIYRDGDILIASPGAPMRRGDRILVVTRDGDRFLGLLHRQTTRRVDFKSLDHSQEHNIALTDLRLLARLVWASQ